MKLIRTLLVAASLAALGACTMQLSDQDRALITAEKANEQQANDLAQQALNAAQAAQASANTAAQSASKAASDAQQANEKADRMFQRSLRKTSSSS